MYTFLYLNILQNLYKKRVREVCCLIFVKQDSAWIYHTVMTAFQISLENSGKLDYWFRFFTLSLLCVLVDIRPCISSHYSWNVLPHSPMSCCHKTAFCCQNEGTFSCASSQCGSRETSVLAHSLVSCR